MLHTISFSELVSNGFVPLDEQERLRRYLQARGKFINIFGPGSGDGPDGRALEAVRQAAHVAEVLRDQLMERHAFLSGHVLPLVIELLQREPERLRDFEGQLRAFGDQIPAQILDLPLRILGERLEGSLSELKALEPTLNVLRDQLQ